MEKFKNICETIKGYIPKKSNWEMDDRFNTPYVSLKIKHSPSIHDNISQLFDTRFDSISIENAPVQIKSLSKNLTDMEDDQLLFTCNEDDKILFCAWWPWGKNKMLSLRFGLFQWIRV